MKSGFLSRRQRNPQRHHESGKEQPFFARSNDLQKQPFFNGASNDSIQTKLSIGQAGDKYEQEADRVAEQVVSGQNTSPLVQKQAISSIQRATLATPAEDEKLSTAENRMEKDKLVQEKPEVQRQAALEEEEPIQKMTAPTEEEEAPVQQKEAEPLEEEPIQKMATEEEEPLQKKADATQPGTASTQLSTRIQNAAGKGRPLANATRSNMEQAFGVDFSGVNVHTDTNAVQMNQELSAQAFTHGQDVYFNAGKYNPGHTEGEKLLAHELTHVVQQGGGGNRDLVQRQVAVPIPAPIIIPFGAIALILAILALAALSIYAAYRYLMAQIAELIDAVETVSDGIEDFVRNNPRQAMRCSAELIAFRQARDAILEALHNPAQFGAFGIIRRLDIFKAAANTLATCLGIPPVF